MSPAPVHELRHSPGMMPGFFHAPKKVLASFRGMAYRLGMATEILSDEKIRAELRKACAEAGTQKAWADSHGISCSYVTDVLLGRRGPGKAILDALGCERAGYRRKRAIPPKTPERTKATKGYDGVNYEN
jgi:hypothetical protein